jgi:amino acid transporter
MASVTQPSSPQEPAPHLERRITWPAGFVLALTVPAGVIASLGYSIGGLGAWSAAALWGTCAAIGIVQNFLFAEMAAMFPDKPGGITLYAQEAWKRYTKVVGAVATWGYWMGWSLGLAVFGLLIGSLVQTQWFPNADWVLWHGPVDVGLQHLIAAGTIVLVWVLNVFGIKPAVWANYLIGGLLVVVLAILIVGPFLTGDWHASRLNWNLGQDGQEWGGARLALVWLFLMGWSGYATEMCATFAPEYKNVKRDTWMALKTSGGFALLVLTLLPIAVAGTMGEKPIAADPVGFYVADFHQIIGGASDFVVASLCAALFLSMNSNTADASRALYGMSREGLTVKQLDHLNHHRVPGRAMTVDMVINLALVFLVGNILGVLFASNVGYFIAIVFVLIGYILLRRDRPDATRPIKLGRIWIPIAAVLAAFNAVLAVVGTLSPKLTGYGGTKEILIGLGLVAVSLPLYAIRRYGQRDPDDPAAVGPIMATPPRSQLADEAPLGRTRLP